LQVDSIACWQGRRKATRGESRRQRAPRREQWHRL